MFFSAKGRVGRKDFWIAMLLLAVLRAPLSLLGPLGDWLDLLMLFPYVCLLAKRLHDRGRSGWMAAVPIVLVTVADVVSAFTRETDGVAPPILTLAGSCVVVVCVIAGVVFFLRAALASSGDDENRYGPPSSPYFDRKRWAATDASVS